MLTDNLNYTTVKGLLTELSCQNAFSEVGILLSQPIINDSRYDFIADIEGKLYKIQCKSSTTKDDDNAFTFAVSSKNWNSGERHSYQDQVDFFFTTFDDVNYLIPVNDVGVSSKTLRLYCKNNEPSIAWAKDYEFFTMLKKLGYNIPDFVYSDNRDKEYLNELKSRKEKETNVCIDCGAPISKCATRCQECYRKIARENSINIDREELKMKIRTMPFTSIGKDYGVTDGAIRKWCDKYGLPRKKADIKKISDSDWELI